MDKFVGNTPANVNKDAKYSVRTVNGRPVVALNYISVHGETWLATTEEHSKLVDLVNHIKLTKGEGPNGPFYVNEYGQVIVPVSDGTYYLAGEYHHPIRFHFEDTMLSGEAFDMTGSPLLPGDTWEGPHPGIPYILKAGGGDVYYSQQLRPNVTKKISLSSFVGIPAARMLAKRVQMIKDWQGGRFYVNEWREMFAPVNDEGDLSYVYIGRLGEDDPWFPKPMQDD